MNLACQLKTKADQPERDALVAGILGDLHLAHRRENTADKLSGGERKRLSIAIELVANPTILFLDEPTSGLDEVTAIGCIRALKTLAQLGKTVVCTIHQPSGAIFSLFDNIYILAKGNCIYQGHPKGLVPYLAHNNLECPLTYNPADYSESILRNWWL